MDDEQTWIGITKCDEWRENRTKDTAELVKELVNISDYDKAALISLPSLDLLREAYSCYQNGAYMGVAIMCRAVTEAAIYFSITRRDNLPRVYSGGVIKVDFNYIDSEWQEIMNKAKELGIADGKLEKRVNDIRSYGNSVVHYGEKLDKHYFDMRQGKSATAPVGWLDRKKALGLLHETISIFNEVLKGQAQVGSDAK